MAYPAFSNLLAFSAFDRDSLHQLPYLRVGRGGPQRPLEKNPVGQKVLLRHRKLLLVLVSNHIRQGAVNSAVKCYIGD